MRRKTIIIAGVVIVSLLGVLVTLVLLLTHEPGFYQEKVVAEGSQRTKHSKTFLANATALWNGIDNQRPTWRATFHEVDINSYLQEGFVKQRMDVTMLPKGISEPRIAIEHDRVRLAFRYGRPPWSTVVSLDFRVWKAPKENNVVLLQLNGLYAGALPISTKLVMNGLANVLKGANRDIDVSWYRHEGNLTAVVRFGGANPRPTLQLLRLLATDGKLVVEGRSLPEIAPQDLSAQR